MVARAQSHSPPQPVCRVPFSAWTAFTQKQKLEGNILWNVVAGERDKREGAAAFGPCRAKRDTPKPGTWRGLFCWDPLTNMSGQAKIRQECQHGGWEWPGADGLPIGISLWCVTPLPSCNSESWLPLSPCWFCPWTEHPTVVLCVCHLPFSWYIVI